MDCVCDRERFRTQLWSQPMARVLHNLTILVNTHIFVLTNYHSFLWVSPLIAFPPETCRVLHKSERATQGGMKWKTISAHVFLPQKHPKSSKSTVQANCCDAAVASTCCGITEIISRWHGTSQQSIEWIVCLLNWLIDIFEAATTILILN